MYDAAPEADRELYNDAYQKTVISMLGENEGKAVVDYIQGQRELGETKLTREGNTDTGNSYTVKYNNNKVDIAVVCSEVKKVEETTEEETAAVTENTQTTKMVSGTKRIKIGTQTNQNQ